MLLCTIIIVLTVAIDQISKYLVLHNIELNGNVPVLQGLFHFTYIENKGAAFGMLSGQRWIFMLISVAAIIIFLVYLIKYKPQSKLLRIALSLIVGGGIGNMIDRCFRGSVIDFINIDFVDFYVFNAADTFVCVGCGLMILYLLIFETPKGKNKVKAEKEEL